MKATTIRFGQDLWDSIAAEAERAGVSTSQFIREAALARAAAAAGARGEMLFDAGAAATDEAPRSESVPPDRHREIENALVRAAAADTRSGSQALRAQSKQAQRLSASLQRDSKQLKRSA